MSVRVWAEHAPDTQNEWATHGIEKATHGIEKATHGAEKATHGAEKATHGPEWATHGAEKATHGTEWATHTSCSAALIPDLDDRRLLTEEVLRLIAAVVDDYLLEHDAGMAWMQGQHVLLSRADGQFDHLLDNAA